MANVRYSNGAKRRALRKRLAAEHRPCHICGKEIDYNLPAGHPLAFEVDEIIPVSRALDYGYESAGAAAIDYQNVDAAHRICNQRRGKKMHMKPKAHYKPIEHSREW